MLADKQESMVLNNHKKTGDGILDHNNSLFFLNLDRCSRLMAYGIGLDLSNTLTERCRLELDLDFELAVLEFEIEMLGSWASNTNNLLEVLGS